MELVYDQVFDAARYPELQDKPALVAEIQGTTLHFVHKVAHICNFILNIKRCLKV